MATVFHQKPIDTTPTITVHLGIGKPAFISYVQGYHHNASDVCNPLLGNELVKQP